MEFNQDIFDFSKPRPPKENEVLRANKGWYQLFNNLYRGGRSFFTPAGAIHPISGEPISSYLVPHEKERSEEYFDRVKNSFTLPYAKEIITIFTSTIFRQEVVRDQVEKVLTKDIVSNVDLKGHSAREFLRNAFSNAQIFGWIGVLTDYPRRSNAYLSSYHESLDGNRPYSYFISPLDLWDWVKDPGTGDFLYAEICYGEYWRRWYQNQWMDVDKDGKLLDGGEHSFGRVPLDILVCDEIKGNDPLAPFGQSVLSDTSLMLLNLYQMCSLLESQERRALFAFLHISADPTKYKEGGVPDLQLGNSHYLWNEGAVDWVEPPASVPQEAREQIIFLVSQIRHVSGVSTRAEDSIEAHSGAALEYEYSSRHNAVYERAQNLEDFESRLWSTYGQWMELDIPRDSIRYPNEYVIAPAEQELSEIERLGKIADTFGIQKEIIPYIRKKLRRVAIRDIGHLPDSEEVLDSIDKIGQEEPKEKIPLDNSFPIGGENINEDQYTRPDEEIH